MHKRGPNRKGVLRYVEFDSGIWSSNGNIALLAAFMKENLKLQLLRGTVDVQLKRYSRLPFCRNYSSPRIRNDDDKLVLMSRA